MMAEREKEEEEEGEEDDADREVEERRRKVEVREWHDREAEKAGKIGQNRGIG